MRKDIESFKNFLTWMPAIFFPGSHMVQIHKMLHMQSSAGVSPITFSGYFFGNVGAYLFAGKYRDIRTLLSFVLTAILEVVIVTMIAYYRGHYTIAKMIVAAGFMVALMVYHVINHRRKWLGKHADKAGWLPAVMFPAASVFQLTKIHNEKNIRGVSCVGWIMQIFANLGAYLLVDKLQSPQNILAFLATALIDIIIVITIYRKTGSCTLNTKSIF